MRLVCPNCDAEYEVDVAAIPDVGRDVQCSNCGHGWYQLSPDLEAELEAEETRLAALSAPPQAKTPARPPLPALTTWDEDVEDEQEEAPRDPPRSGFAPTGAAPAALPRRGMDESLLAVLREEAAREASVRRSEMPRALEQQTDLGLPDPTGAASAARVVRDRLARLRGPDPEPSSTDRPAARRDLLPDIEEINSTLRASTENRGQDRGGIGPRPEAARGGSSGFRSGFSVMLLVAVVAVVVYAAAPRIAEQLPAAGASLDSYVAAVNVMRLWLDGAMRDAIFALQGLTGGTET